MPLVTVPLFVLSVISLFVGQTSIPILFFAAVSWRLLEKGSDRLAGVALACVTTKPQVTAIALVLAAPALGSAAAAAGGSCRSCMLALTALAGTASAWIVPDWPIEMVRASQRTPQPTTYFPWIGTTWFLMLKTVGLQSWALWGLYLAAAIPFLGLVTSAAVDRARPVEDIMALGLLAAFIVAPYGRHYDFPVLLIPLFVLMGRRLSEVAGTILLVALLGLYLHLHFGILIKFKEKYPSNVRLFPEFTFFWIPLVLTVIWLATEAKAARSRAAV